MKKVKIYTDGACLCNPGAGGWGAILKYGSVEKELSDGAADTTNNRMELTAAIKALSALKEPCEVELYSDSKYLSDAIKQGWLSSWAKNGWKKADKKPVLNRDLWEELYKLISIHYVAFFWVKGHDGHTENERCDSLAGQMAQKYKKEDA